MSEKQKKVTDLVDESTKKKVKHSKSPRLGFINSESHGKSACLRGELWMDQPKTIQHLKVHNWVVDSVPQHFVPGSKEEKIAPELHYGVEVGEKCEKCRLRSKAIAKAIKLATDQKAIADKDAKPKEVTTEVKTSEADPKVNT